MPFLRKQRHSTSTLVIFVFMIFAGFFTKDACCSVLPVIGHGKKTNSTSFPFSDDIDFYCSHDRTWIDEPYFEIRQCYMAIMYMLSEESDDPSQPNIERKNFISRSAPQHVRDRNSVLTPRKYVAHECTLAVLMRSDVHPGDLPSEDGHSPIVSDISSYDDIATAAEAVYNHCCKAPLRVPGWAQIGYRHGMAVALWATGSSIDRRYPNLRRIDVPVVSS